MVTFSVPFSTNSVSLYFSLSAILSFLCMNDLLVPIANNDHSYAMIQPAFIHNFPLIRIILRNLNTINLHGFYERNS